MTLIKVVDMKYTLSPRSWVAYNSCGSISLHPFIAYYQVYVREYGSTRQKTIFYRHQKPVLDLENKMGPRNSFRFLNELQSLFNVQFRLNKIDVYELMKGWFRCFYGIQLADPEMQKSAVYPTAIITQRTAIIDKRWPIGGWSTSITEMECRVHRCVIKITIIQRLLGI